MSEPQMGIQPQRELQDLRGFKNDLQFAFFLLDQ